MSLPVVIVVGVLLIQCILFGLLLEVRRRRTRVEDTLRVTEARNAALLRMVPDLMFVMSRDGVYLDYHARDPGDLFVPPEQFIGKHIGEVFPPELAEPFKAVFQQALTSDEPVTIEYSLQMPEGEQHFETRLLRCDNDTIMTIVRNVTKRHQSEEALHRAQAELAQATRLGALGEVAASIAHEVNQPLSAIITNARACLRQLDASPVDVQGVRDALHDVVSDGKRATDVISRIRGMVKQAPQHRGAVSVNDVIENVIALSRRLLRERRVHLHLTLADDLPMVAGDRVQLQQVLLNLVLNAADAMQATMPRARTLRIRSDRCPHGIVVSVADSGSGFSDDHLRRVFTPFFTTKPEGMGIGLSISRSIVEAHGGRLNLTQNSHNGATFELELPVAS